MSTRPHGSTRWLVAIVLAGCASSPWGDAGIERERTFWGVSEDRLRAAALAVVRELDPESHRVHPDRGTIHAEGAIGRCREHAHCPRRTPGTGPSRLWTRLRIDFTRGRTSIELVVSAEYEAVACRAVAPSDCIRSGVPSTGELEEEIVRRVRERVARRGN